MRSGALSRMIKTFSDHRGGRPTGGKPGGGKSKAPLKGTPVSFVHSANCAGVSTARAFSMTPCITPWRPCPAAVVPRPAAVAPRPAPRQNSKPAQRPHARSAGSPAAGCRSGAAGPTISGWLKTIGPWSCRVICSSRCNCAGVSVARMTRSLARANSRNLRSPLGRGHFAEVAQRIEPPLREILGQGLDLPALGVVQGQVVLHAAIGQHDELAGAFQDGQIVEDFLRVALARRPTRPGWRGCRAAGRRSRGNSPGPSPTAACAGLGRAACRPGPFR